MYQGNSLLLDFFTKDHGKLRLIARGARSSKTSLQMFQCLSISYKGKGDLKSLFQWEISDEPRRLLGNDLVMAMYCLLYTSPSPRDRTRSRMPSSA